MRFPIINVVLETNKGNFEIVRCALLRKYPDGYVRFRPIEIGEFFCPSDMHTNRCFLQAWMQGHMNEIEFTGEFFDSESLSRYMKNEVELCYCKMVPENQRTNVI